MPLNINLQQILLHALNFVILFGAMYFLLYKPVKSFMDSRKAHYEKMDEDAKAVLAEAEKTKAGYEAQLKSADEEIARRQREANEALQHAVDERRAQAEQQAGEIVRKARNFRADERRGGKAGALQHVGRLRQVPGHGGGAQGQWLSARSI